MTSALYMFFANPNVVIMVDTTALRVRVEAKKAARLFRIDSWAFLSIWYRPDENLTSHKFTILSFRSITNCSVICHLRYNLMAIYGVGVGMSD